MCLTLWRAGGTGEGWVTRCRGGRRRVTRPWVLTAPSVGEIGSGEMNPAEAALADGLLGVWCAIATHYDDRDHGNVTALLVAVAERNTSGERVGPALRSVLDGDRYEVVEA